MIPETRFAGKRIRNTVLLIGAALLMAIFFFFRYNAGFERVIINIFLILCFSILVLIVLPSRRLKGDMGGNRSETYGKLTLVFAASAGILILYSFLPHYIAPFMLLAFFLTQVSSPEIGLMMSIFLGVYSVVNSGGTMYELAQYMVLTAFGTALVPLYRSEKNRPTLAFIVFCVSVVVPGIFSYLPAGQLDLRVIGISAATGLAVDLIFILLFDRMELRVVKAEERSIRELISERYPLMQEIRSFSPEAYQHAKMVSLLAARCASVASLRPDIAAAGGFYYRLGILGGEPIVDNGVLLAQLNCFPQSVITILAEYNGQKKKISTPESAVVNMINHLVSRFEHLQDKTRGSAWNRDIVIYQTLNELSESGLYDKSGLSINAYLKIREYLVRGDDFR